MDELTLDDNLNSELILDSQSRAFLRETAKWAKFLAIVGFVGMGLMVIIAMFMGSIMASLGPALGDMPGAGVTGGFISALYIGFAILGIIPLLYMYRFAVKIKQALDIENQEVLIAAFENLKSYYKFIGIFTAIILGLYAFIFISTILMGTMAG